MAEHQPQTPSLAHLAAIVESSDDAIFTQSLDGVILSWNRAAERMYGYTAAEAIGRPLAALISAGASAASELLARVARGERIVQYETRWEPKDGRPIDVSLTISPIVDAFGAITAAATIGRDVTERRQHEEALRQVNAELHHKAHHDSLTGLPNRTLFADRLRHALARARRYGNRVAVLLVDVNGFKQINDTFGHPAGDEVLVEIAARLRAGIRQSDTVARWGGDEFSAVLSDVRTAEDAARAAERLVAAFLTPMRVAGQQLSVTITIGISLYPNDGEAPDDLLRRADHAMYRADAGMRENTFAFFRTVGEDGDVPRTR
ncbi:MAG TPA: diguanylate cyclase [bacterium]|nr:diguanylate cyclase [bacterium]